MQRYETLAETLKPLQKNVKDGTAAAVSAQKKIAKSLDTGNLTEAGKLLASLKETAAQLIQQTEALEKEIAKFDVQDYFVSGDFTEQLLEACAKQGIDVKGEKGVYEIDVPLQNSRGRGRGASGRGMDGPQKGSELPALVRGGNGEKRAGKTVRGPVRRGRLYQRAGGSL